MPKSGSGCGEGTGNPFCPGLCLLTLPPCHVLPTPTPPQKLKDEIADVFAQIDCFETTEER